MDTLDNFDSRTGNPKTKVIIAIGLVLLIAVSIALYYFLRGDRVEITDSQVLLNGIAIQLPTSLEALSSTLGNPDRPLGDKNNAFAWDRFGLRVFAFEGVIYSITFDVTKASDDNRPTPTKFFNGSIQVDGMNLSGAIDPTMLTSQKKGRLFKEDLNDTFKSFSPDKIVTIRLDKASKQIVSLEVIEKATFIKKLREEGINISESELNKTTKELILDKTMNDVKRN